MMVDVALGRRTGCFERAGRRRVGARAAVLAGVAGLAIALVATPAHAQRTSRPRPTIAPQAADEQAAAITTLEGRQAQALISQQARAIDLWGEYVEQAQLGGEERMTPAILDKMREAAYQQLVDAFGQGAIPPLDDLDTMGPAGLTVLNDLEPGVRVDGPAPNGDGDGRDGPGGEIEVPLPGANPLEGVLADEQGLVQLSFTDAVDLVAFADFVARALNVNIILDPGLQGQEVIFKAPLKVHVDELLPLLARLVEERGYAMSYDRLGFYSIRTMGQSQVDVPGGKIPSSVIIKTPLIIPSLLVGPANEFIGTNAAQNVRITPIDDLNLLVVAGPPTLVQTIEDYINEIVAIQQEQVYTRIDLEHVSSQHALEQVLYLNGEVAQSTATPTARPSNVRGRTPRASAGGGATAGALVDLESKLSVSSAGNALVFRGTTEEAELVRQLIAQVDHVSQLEARLYKAGPVSQRVANAGINLGLGNVSYTQDIDTGDLGGSSSRGSVSRGSGAFPSRGGSVSGFNDDVAVGGSQFLIDLATGDIIFFGTEAQHAIVDDLVHQFLRDYTPTNTIIEVYKLDNIPAADMAELLQQLIEDPLQASQNSQLFGGGRGGGGSSAGAADGASAQAQLVEAGLIEAGPEGSLIATASDTVITPDEINNQVIIRSRPAAQKQFAKLIRQLDKRRPQVAIDVQIVSVTTDSSFNWATDFQVNIGSFSAFSGFRTGALADRLDTGLIDGGLIPAAVSPGINIGIIDTSSVSFVLDALETVGETRISSRPNIMVNDNGEAILNSIRQEPQAEISQGSNTTTTGAGTPVEAGTRLNVTPQISSGGYITLDYRVELSDFDRAANVQPGLAPPTQSEIYESVVTLPSDSTIIVGGFSLDFDGESESKVPLLGDIPIVGNAFKRINNQRQRRTIFVFMTPKILDNPNFEGLKTLTLGPAAEAGIKGDHPKMEPAMIPIQESGLDRLIEANRPPTQPPATID